MSAWAGNGGESGATRMLYALRDCSVRHEEGLSKEAIIWACATLLGVELATMVRFRPEDEVLVKYAIRSVENALEDGLRSNVLRPFNPLDIAAPSGDKESAPKQDRPDAPSKP